MVDRRNFLYLEFDFFILNSEWICSIFSNHSISHSSLFNFSSSYTLSQCLLQSDFKEEWTWMFIVIRVAWVIVYTLRRLWILWVTTRSVLSSSIKKCLKSFLHAPCESIALLIQRRKQCLNRFYIFYIYCKQRTLIVSFWKTKALYLSGVENEISFHNILWILWLSEYLWFKYFEIQAFFVI